MDNNCDRAKRRLIVEGDICVIHISENHRNILKIESNELLQTKFGNIRGTDLIGHPYGIRFNCKKGWVLPLMLTPELWTQLLPHRTQILYQADISMILIQLDIKPGSIVVESGTGSGSLSHAILRACRPNGYLYTFDNNESRVKDAQSEFKGHKFSDNVRATHRNVCSDGFGDDLIEKADACVLDLPQTWEAIEHAHKILKPHGSKLCTFSPCIEQVKQNVTKMMELKMKDIVTLETLLRPYDIREQTFRVWDCDTLDRLVAIDKKRLDNIEDYLQSTKRVKISQSTDQDETNNDDASTMDVDHSKEAELPLISSDHDSFLLHQALTDPKRSFHPHMLPKSTITYPKKLQENVSHSGFLTFATKRP